MMAAEKTCPDLATDRPLDPAIMDSLQQFLPWLLPPVMGAFIGYLTNRIAIRMLFRPLHPWRILGVRLPMTPGIIPAKRGELAEKMGEMVGSHLLTSADVGRTLEKEGFRRELQATVSDKLRAFLDRDLGPVASLVPDPYRPRFRELVDLLRWKVARTIDQYLQSPEFEQRLRSYLQQKGNELLARDLESFLTPQRYDGLRNHLDERIGTMLRSEGMSKAVGSFIDARSEKLLSSQRPLRELLPDDLIALTLAQLEKEIPPLLEKFGGMLYDPDFRQRLVKKGKEGIEHFLDSLGGLSGLLAGLINMEKVYARLPEFLDQAGDEIARWLREEKTQAQVGALLRERLEGLLDKPVAAFLDKVPYEKVSSVRRFVRLRAVELVRSRRATDTLLGLAEQGLDRYKDRSFGSLLDHALPAGGLDKLREELIERLLAALRSPGAREALAEVLAEKSEEWLFQRPLGKLSAHLPADMLEELEAFLYQQLAEVLKKEVPPLVETLNVRRMVEEKVNGLDLLQVEGLLMGIMQEQFKYINLFGALLGFLIGLLNLLALGLS
jgi:uncharacterized membrane protein YheB (UPF0754 family)